MRSRRLLILAPAAMLLLAQAPVVQTPAIPASVPEVEHLPSEQTEAVLGARVSDVDGKSMGRLVDILVDSAGQPQAAVIDVGGFMGVGNRRIAVHWSALRFNQADASSRIVIDMTAEQIRAAPQYRDTTRGVAVVTPGQSALKADTAPPPQ